MGEVNRSMKSKKLAQRAGLPRRVKDMSKEQLQAALLQKKECNTRALVIVERLLENTVSEDWFLESLKYISDNHFQDIIEERVILRLCGYPLCHQGLKDIPTQQYRISTRLNKVYDISERKNFCSNQCYKAGKYIKDQLLTSPLWLRNKEEIPIFKVLPVGTSGTGAGEEVDIGQNDNKLKEEVAQIQDDNFTSVAQFTQVSLSALSKRIDKLEKKERENIQVSKEIKNLDDNKKDSGRKEAKNVRFEDENTILDNSKINSVKNELKPDHNKNCAVEESGLLNKEALSSDIMMDRNENICVQLHGLINEKASTGSPELGRELNCQDRGSEEFVNKCENDREVKCELNVTKCQNDTRSRKSVDNNKSETPNSNSVCSTDTQNDTVKTISQKTKKEDTVKDKVSSKSKKKSRHKQEPDVLPVTNSIIHIEKCLHEWFTLDSMCFLFGEDKVKEMVIDKGECIIEYYKAIGSTTRDAAMREKYEAICRRLNLLELEENKFDGEARQLKPLPDYTAVREESKKMQLKVKAFFQGKTDFETPKELQSVVEKDDAPSAILPLVDLHAQNALRRRIVLDRLNRILPDLLRTFGLSSRDVTTDLRALFCTFTLAAHNITFKPPEWSLLGLVIIKMLSVRDIRLKMMLDTEQANKYQTMMLMAFNQDGGYLDRLMAWLTDIDNILQKQPLSKIPDKVS